MAILDLARNAVVIRVVYDGPPAAGKTTSVRTLAESLGRSVYSPREVSGHTLFFDWLDYSGGRFEGLEIRCQVVSVPGQAVLAPRRRRLLETADVVVFVSDTTLAAVAAARSYLEGLMQVAAAIPGPPVGIVIQANKRDLPGVVELERLQRELGTAEADLAVVETVATSGVGVRQAFILAVRLGMDRVRELIRTGELASGSPEVDSGPALLERLEGLEGDVMALAASAQGLRHTSLHEEPAAAVTSQAVAAEGPAPGGRPAPPPPAPERRSILPGGPWLPDPMVPGESIWPPVTGRVVLHEVSSLPIEPRRGREREDWLASAGGSWWIHSPAGSSYAEAESGRRALIEWARLHAGSLPLLSNPRAIVLAEAGDGTWRLWQIVRRSPSLRQRLLESLEGDGEPAARRLFETALLLLQAAAKLQTAACALRVDLDTVGEIDHGPLYIGPMPEPARAGPPEPYREGLDLALLARELRPILTALAEPRRESLRRYLEPLAADPFAAPRGMGELLLKLLAERAPAP